MVNPEAVWAEVVIAAALFVLKTMEQEVFEVACVVGKGVRVVIAALAVGAAGEMEAV